jgi:hypothetical protein
MAIFRQLTEPFLFVKRIALREKMEADQSQPKAA